MASGCPQDTTAGRETSAARPGRDAPSGSCSSSTPTPLDFNNYGYSNPEFDALIAEAKASTDEGVRNQLFQEAERPLLNTDVMTVPINWYLGDYAFNPDTLDGFGHSALFLIHWEQITVTK